MNNTVAFWIESNLSNVDELINQYDQYAEQGNEDFAEMYREDRDDFKKAVALFRQSDAEALSQHIDYMDTSPREEIVMAFAKDLGAKFVALTLGYEIRA